MVPTYRYFHHELFFEGGEPSYAGKEIIETPMERGNDGWWRLPRHNESFRRCFQ